MIDVGLELIDGELVGLSEGSMEGTIIGALVGFGLTVGIKIVGDALNEGDGEG